MPTVRVERDEFDMSVREVNVMLRYEQVEAIYEATRDLEQVVASDRANETDLRASAAACIDTVRKALAGDAKPWAPRTGFDVSSSRISAVMLTDERMVRPEDVAPPVAEREDWQESTDPSVVAYEQTISELYGTPEPEATDEDSKITWQG